MTRAWVDFWNRREAPTSLALVRILVSVAIVADLLLAYELGVVEAIWAPPPHGIGYGALSATPPFIVRIFGTTAAAWAAWGGALVTAALLGIGLATRLSAIAFVCFSAQLAHLAPDSDRGVDLLLRIVASVLALSGSHAMWSADAWLRKRITGRSIESIPAWPRYLLFAQLVWMYFSAGINKRDRAWGPEGDFAALASILSDPHFARFDARWLEFAYPLTQLATLATMAFELGAPLFLLACILGARASHSFTRRLARYLRWGWLAAGLCFHLGIALTMRLGMFPFGVLAVWPVFFSPEEVAAILARSCSLCRRTAT